MRSHSRVFFAVFLLVTSAAFSQESSRRTVPDGPPMLPLPIIAGATRGAMVGLRAPLRIAAERASVSTDDTSQTVFLPLSAGVSMISIPLRTDSDRLSDLLPNLPQGSRVWTWDGDDQEFVEGFDQQLPIGQGALLYVPVPVVLTITGHSDLSSEIPVELKNGWNLIGVPYTNAVPRASLTVYAGEIATAFDDAVDQGDVSEPVITLRSNGYENVESQDSLLPMSAYWVFSNDAELLEIPPALLKNELAKKLAWWAAEKAGTAALKEYGPSELVSFLFPDPNVGVLSKLNDIQTQLTSIQQTQQDIKQGFTDVLGRLNLLEQTVYLAAKEVNVSDARANVASHYDDTAQNTSFMYFVNAALIKDGKLVNPTAYNSITDANRIAFANNVLVQWDFVKSFNTIKFAVLPEGGGPGILDNVAEQIIISAPTGGTLEDRYKSFEAYFNNLITLQVKCMTLLTNAWNTLAAVPGSGYSAGFADDWRQTKYWPVIVEEANRFRDATDRVLASSVKISTTASDPPVSIPAEVSNTILPRLDFGLKQLLSEKEGMRVRVLMSPFFNGNTVSIVDFGSNPDSPQKTTLIGPLSDSTGWKTMVGPKSYDYWALDSNGTPHLYFGNNWIMYSTVLSDPPSRRVGKWNVKVVDTMGITEDSDAKKYPPQQSGLYYVDNNGTPNTPSASIKFGTVMVAKRTSARSVLRMPKNVVKNSAGCGGGTTKFGKEVDYFVIQTCVSGSASMTGDLLFYYDQGQPPVKTTVETNLRFKASRGNGCSGCSYAQVSFLTPGGTSVSSLKVDSNTSKPQSDSFTWTPGVWTLRMYLQLSASNKEIAEAWKGPIVMKVDN